MEKDMKTLKLKTNNSKKVSSFVFVIQPCILTKITYKKNN